MIFLVVRTVFMLLGGLLFVQALFGIPYAVLERAWGVAATMLLYGVFGVWLFRVGAKGTFSGESPSALDRMEPPLADDTAP